MTVHDAWLVYFAVAFGVPSGIVVWFGAMAFFSAIMDGDK